MIETDKKPLEVEEVKASSLYFVGIKDKEVMNKPEKLRLVCNKCSKEWMENRLVGYYVRYEKGNVFLINRLNPHDKKSFTCPKCKNQKNIGRLSLVIILKNK